MPSRRTVLIGGAAAVTGAVILAYPADKGGPRGAYFSALEKTLRAAGIAAPTLVIDRARLDANAKHIVDHIGGRMALRLVAKSLPSLPLLDHLMAATGTHRLMVFNEAFTRHLANERPKTSLLLGKPLPVDAAAHFYANAKRSGFDPGRQLEWLVDGPERLAQYLDLAKAQSLPLGLNIELDVGLNRGGVEDPKQLHDMLTAIKQSPLLRFSGLMGYDAHLAKIPDLFGSRGRATERSKARYDEMLRVAEDVFGDKLVRDALTLNTAGSPTYRLHDGKRAPNELAVGSAFVKGSDFDTALLDDLDAACFIATPILKDLGPFRLPDGVEAISKLASLWDVNQTRGYAIHGGAWMADPVSPPGLEPSGLFGHSTNQQVMVASPTVDIKPDDLAFFRPRQSEFLFLQFGDIVVVDGNKIAATWPVFPASA